MNESFKDRKVYLKTLSLFSVFLQVRGYGANLTVRISSGTVGRYICRASVYGFTEIHAEASVLMRGPPRFIRKQELQYGVIEENVQLVCEAFAIPPPENIIWTRHSFPVTTTNTHYYLKNEAREDGMKSTLTIKNASRPDFGEYTCTVKNSHGEDEFVIKLEVQKSSFLIVILSAVIGGIIITMFAIVLMVMCRRSSFGPANSNGTASTDKTSSCAYATSIITNTSANSGSTSCTSSSKPTTILSNGSSGLCHTSSGCPPVSVSSKAFSTRGLESDWTEKADEETAAESADLLNGGFTSSDTNGPRIINGYGDLPSPQQQRSFDYTNGNGAYVVDGFLQQDPLSDPYNGGFPQQPPPPPMHGNGLNVVDPRYAAKYGNPYLVQSQQQPSYPSSPRMQQMQQQQRINFNNNHSNGGRPYATLNSRGGYSPVHSQPQKKHVNYAGTMLGNGSLRRNGNMQQSQQQQQMSNKSKYIVSPEAESGNKSSGGASGSLATHV